MNLNKRDMKMKSALYETVPTVDTTVVSGAEAVIRCLLAEGVETIYGYPGGAIMPVYVMNRPLHMPHRATPGLQERSELPWQHQVRVLPI